MLSFSAFKGYSQQACGTTFEEQALSMDRLKSNLAYAEKHGFPENAVTYVPVFFHLAANSAGDGRANMNSIFSALCTMNNDYAAHDIQFYLSPHPTLGLVDNTINNDGVFNNQSNSFLMGLKRHNNAINYFVVGTAASNNSQPGGAAAYYTSQRDWVVINKSYMGNGDNTIAHETGHFFSLAHTFFGWESDAEDWENQPPCFDPNDPGWPCAPAISPGGSPTEKADGSNSTTAADLISDTPPDYNFGYCANGCETYNGGAQDPNCQSVSPMNNNFMSYYFSCADYEFTPGQEAAMKADLNSNSRNFLDNNFTPAALTITTPNDLLVTPASNQVGDDDTAFLSWNEVPGATYYYVELDRTTSFISPLGQNHVVSGTSLLVTGLTPNKKYFWRVRPFNEYYVCASFKQDAFFTGTEDIVPTVDTQNLKEWQLAPNPASADQPVSVVFNTTTALQANISVFDAAGRQVYTQNGITVNAGQSMITLPSGRLSEGVYFVNVETDGQVETKRLVIIH